jgi:4-azaleucine resistance transporter AzlC
MWHCRTKQIAKMMLAFSGTTTRQLAKRGLKGISLATPIVFGYIPIGFAYGVLALKAGLSPANTLWMSVFVYAGSSQFIAVGLIAGGAPALTVILTTLVVNLRHMLMSASLSPFLRKWRRLELLLFGFELTDETFVLHSARFAALAPHKIETFTINLTAQLSWILGSWLGVLTGQQISDIRPYGLDFALPAMFIALLVYQLKDKAHLLAGLFAGGLAVGLALMGVEHWNVILATLAGATMGVFLESWINKPSS